MPQSTILIVDDEPNLRETLALILQGAGHAVTTTGHPHNALQILKTGGCDLMFLDLTMPDMDGITLLTKVREVHPDLPVLILTANATLESAIEAVRQGARDYLIKPVDPPTILDRVAKILSEQQQPQRKREIVNELQSLLAELQQIDGEDAPPANLLAAVPPTASTRFLKRGPFTLDLHTRHAMLDNDFVALPPSAFDYLVTLARHAPKPVSYEELVMQSQGYQVTRVEAQELVRWRMYQLRKALEPDPKNPRYIITVRSIGYRLAT